VYTGSVLVEGCAAGMTKYGTVYSRSGADSVLNYRVKAVERWVMEALTDRSSNLQIVFFELVNEICKKTVYFVFI